MNILYIENSEFQIKNMKEICFELGHEMFCAKSLDEVISILKVETIDLVFVSASLISEPDKDILSKINISTENSIPILIFTSSDKTKVQNAFIPYGIAGVFSKQEMNKEGIEKAIIEVTSKRDLFKESLHKLKFCVLDDSKIISLFIANILKNKTDNDIGYFINPVDFLKKFKENPNAYDVLITDIMLPEMTGIEVVTQVRKLNQFIPIMAISSVGNFNTIAEVLNNGADEFLKKPFDSDIFMVRLKIALRNSKVKKELYKMQKDFDKSILKI